MAECPEVEQIGEIAEKAEESADKRFSKRVALLTAVYAVVLSICALGGSNAAKEMMMEQQKATNQWGHYQAKAQREHFYKLERSILEVELATRESQSPVARERFEKLLAQLSGEENRFAQEKIEIAQKASHHEEERDRSMKKDPYFDYSEVLLQLAIILASVSIISGSRKTLWLSLVSAGLGVFLGANGFLLFVDLPFLS